MASKFIVSRSIKPQSNSLTQDLLLKLSHPSTRYQVKWGGEYVNFGFSNSPIVDEEIRKVIRELGLSIPAQIRFFPEGGSHSLIGYLSTSKVETRDYSIDQFYELCRTADELILISDNLSSSELTEKNISVHIEYTTDYSRTVTVLKERNLLETFPSRNFLSVDERTFSILPSALRYVPQMEKYLDTSYEVDSLGTNFHQHLTACVVCLFHLTQSL
jgi:hypothetical protein